MMRETQKLTEPGRGWRAEAIGWLFLLALTAAVVPAGADPDAGSTASRFDPFEATILELQLAMGAGRLNARELTEYYLARIERYDQAGVSLNSIALVNPEALTEADLLDSERITSGPRGPLHGIPVLVKDNFETIGMPTTAGSVLLAGFMPDHDSVQVARLKAAGAIILGKTNMHEFAYGITSEGSAFGAVRNPYDPTRNPGGSSGGTGAAIAANFAAVGMGSDTCGSIRIPAAHNNLVGLRGTQGLSSRRGIVPLSHTQDIGGPIARSVSDLALVLDATVGFDPQDAQTALSVGNLPASYLRELTPDALRGKRIGVLEDLLLLDPEDTEIARVIGRATAELGAAGAVLVRVRIPELDAVLNVEPTGFFVLAHDFKTDINGYLAAHPEAPVRSLAEILASGRFHPGIDQVLRVSESMNAESEPLYRSALAQRQLIRETVLAVMAEQGLDALAYPTIRRKAAPVGEPQDGSNCQLSSKSGLPAISMPAGFTDDGLPVGLELLGRAWSESDLLAMAFAFEQLAGHRAPPPLLLPAAMQGGPEPPRP